MTLKTGFRVAKPINYSKVDKPKFNIYEEETKIYQDSNTEIGTDLKGYLSTEQTFANPLTFHYELRNFKIKSIQYRVKCADNNETGYVIPFTVSFGNAYLLVENGVGTTDNVFTAWTDMTNDFYDTIIDESIDLVMTGTPSGGHDLIFQVWIQGIQL